MNPNMKKPVISVIMPAYQAARYISQAIASVQSQSCKEPWELLVIDDCSTDATADIVRKHAASDRRIRYIRQNRNRGVAAARNRGIQLVRPYSLPAGLMQPFWMRTTGGSRTN